MSLEDLREITEHDVDVLSLAGLKTKVKVVRVIDGDTLDVAFHRRGELVRYTCRMLGYNAPELRGKTKTSAKLARDYLAHLCMGDSPDDFDVSATWEDDDLQKLLDESENLVHAVFDDFDSFGRAFVTLKTFPRGRCINDLVSDFVKKLKKEL